jgi:hypothetical protein
MRKGGEREGVGVSLVRMVIPPPTPVIQKKAQARAGRRNHEGEDWAKVHGSLSLRAKEPRRRRDGVDALSLRVRFLFAVMQMTPCQDLDGLHARGCP